MDSNGTRVINDNCDVLDGKITKIWFCIKQLS